jgi:hypothetical protein
MRKHWLTAVAAVAALALVSSRASANSLSPGGSVSPDAFANLTLPPGSTLIADTGPETFTGIGGPPAIAGIFREEVIQESAAANPKGGYTFVYQLKDTAVDIGRMSSGGWGLATSPVEVGTTASDTGGATLLGSAGTVNAVSADWTLSKETLGWNFTGGTIPPGGFSYLLVVRTSNTTEAPVTVSIIDGGTAAIVGGFAPGLPLTAVPEPSTMAIAGLGALGMIGYGLRRRKALGA